MSARSHVDVNERRLRPIYDSLDYGNNKKAIQEADKALKKQRDFQCAKALKGLALLRLGRQGEGTQLLEEVHSQSPTDESTLQAMAIGYREMHRLDLIADMYSNAHKAKPDSEDILTALFMAYVRLGDYKKQQQTAMTLHRLKPSKNPYYFWAVMSIVMQAQVDDRLARTMFLPLAERMTQKYVSDNKIEAEAEVRMYLIILEQMEKYEEALNVIRGPMGEKLNCELGYTERKSAELLSKLERWAECNSAYRNLLLKEPDQWKYYVAYFKSLFKLIDSGWVPSEDASCSDFKPDHTLELCVALLNEIEEIVADVERPIRGPLLGRLELLRLLHQRGASQQHIQTVGSAVDLLAKYYKKFGDKYCCFSDLRTQFTLLNTEERDQFMEQIQAEPLPPVATSEDPEIAKQMIKTLQRHITQLQISRFLGFQANLDKEQRSTLIEDCLHRYECGLSLGGDLVPTEQQYSDTYLQLVVHLLHDEWLETKNDHLLWQAIALLERGISKSSSNFQFKILLIRLYCIIGAFSPCTNLYESLEIKHIQNDSLGYVIANQVERLGHFSSAGILYDAMLRFFTLNHKDTTEYLISSYKYGSFPKVQEFVKFRERLQNSMQYASATAGRLLLDMTMETNSHNKTEEILTYMDIDPDKDKTVWSDLRDNRDLKVFSCYDPPDRIPEDMDRKSFEEEKAWLKHRNLTVRCLAAAVKLGQQGAPHSGDSPQNNMNNGDHNKPGMAEVLQGLIDQFSEHMEFCETVEIPNYPLAAQYRTRLSTYLALGLHTFFIDFLKCLLSLHKLQDQNIDQSNEDLERVLSINLVDSLKTLIDKHKGVFVEVRDSQLVFSASTIENMALLTESIGIATLLAGVGHKLLKPVKGLIVKRSKKKKEPTPTLPPIFQSFAALIEGLEKCTNDLRDAAVETDPACLAASLSNLKLMEPIEFLQDKEDLKLLIWKKIDNSLRKSAKEIEQYLVHKLKYLRTLRL